MSRHTLAGHNRTRVIVGYDRPAGAFFLQVWGDDDHPHVEIDCLEDLDQIADFAPEPDGLRDQLICEAAGEADTNTIMRWVCPSADRT